MADKLLSGGYVTLFNDGFTSKIAWARLYTDTGTLVDQQAITFTYQTDKIAITSDVVFSVGAGTTDVSFVILGRTDTLDSEFYRKDLPQLYDFTTAGTLTIDTFTFNVTSTPLQAEGREALLTTGWTSYVTQARINNSGGVVDTKAASLSAVSETVTGYCTFENYLTQVECENAGGVWETNKYNLELAAQVNFDVTGGTSGINNAQLLNAANGVFFSRTLPSPAPYSFTTTGQLRIKTWVIEI